MKVQWKWQICTSSEATQYRITDHKFNEDIKELGITEPIQ